MLVLADIPDSEPHVVAGVAIEPGGLKDPRGPHFGYGNLTEPIDLKISMNMVAIDEEISKTDPADQLFISDLEK